MSTKLTQTPNLAGQDLLTNSSTQTMPLGGYMETADGRGYRYAKIGATATVAGKIYQAPATDATNFAPSGGLTPDASAINDKTIVIADSLTVSADALAGGFMSVAVTPGAGYTYKIAGNTAVSGATGMVVTLEDGIQVALTTTSRLVMCEDPYSGLIVMPTTITAAPAGVANSIITAEYYGWVQTHGACALLNSSNTAIGLGITPGGAEGAYKSGATTLGDIGYQLTTGIDAEYDLVFLTID